MALFEEAFKLTRTCSKQWNCTSPWLLAVQRMPIQVQQQQLEFVRSMPQAMVRRHNGMAIWSPESTLGEDERVESTEGANTEADRCTGRA
eukprot:5596336-Karenia_brevis.AAC.1